MKLGMLVRCIVMYKNLPQFWKQMLQRFYCYTKLLDLCNKKEMSDNVIKKEENAFEDLELYYIDESDKL